MSKKHIPMLIAFSVILVGALVFFVLALLNTEDPGFQDDRQWSVADVQAGLRVSCAGYVPGREADCEAARAITRIVNRRLGHDVFVWESDAPQVEILIGVAAESGWLDAGGDAALAANGDTIVGCSIRTSNTGTLEMMSLVLQHELGHCLNLAPDPFDASIMREVQRTVPDMQHPPRITDSDRKLIRATYGL
jgi:hypothetical protein